MKSSGVIDTRSAICATSPPDSFMPTMFGMRRQPRDRGRQQVHAGHRREVVEQHRHRRRVGHRRVVTDEHVVRHLALEEPGRAHQHGVGAVLRRPLGRLDRRRRRLAAGADDEALVARNRVARGDDRLIAFEVVHQRRFAVRSEHDEAGERAASPTCRAPLSAARYRRDRDRRMAWESARKRRRGSWQ